MNAPASVRENEDEILGFLDGLLRANLATLKREPSYQTLNDCINFINGASGGMKQSALSRVTFNRQRKNVYEIVSSMTDVRPIWNYQTANNEFRHQADILNLIVRNWWRNCYADRRLQDALMYSCVGGSGYLKVEWNP